MRWASPEEGRTMSVRVLASHKSGHQAGFPGTDRHVSFPQSLNKSNKEMDEGVSFQHLISPVGY